MAEPASSNALLAWHWATLLGLALLAPATLPAGGPEAYVPVLRRRQSRREPLICANHVKIRSAPRHRAPSLRQLDSGTPIRKVREWISPEQEHWLYVETCETLRASQRGWLQQPLVRQG